MNWFKSTILIIYLPCCHHHSWWLGSTICTLLNYFLPFWFVLYTAFDLYVAQSCLLSDVVKPLFFFVCLFFLTTPFSNAICILMNHLFLKTVDKRQLKLSMHKIHINWLVYSSIRRQNNENNFFSVVPCLNLISHIALCSYFGCKCQYYLKSKN